MSKQKAIIGVQFIVLAVALISALNEAEGLALAGIIIYLTGLRLETKGNQWNI